MALVKFISCTAAAYGGSAKDEGTLYFLSDTRQIMKGSVPFGGGIYKTVESYPAKGEVNTIYVNVTDGSAKFWNGTDYTVLVKPSTSVLEGKGDDLHLPTTKAVVDYVTQKVADLNVSAIIDRVAALEGKVDVEGKVSAAIAAGVTDAKGYTDTEVAKKADKVHTHVLADITDAGTLAGKSKVAETDLEAALATKINNKADKATTLKGYGITDAYTKEEANTVISAAVANAQHLKREIVENLPAVGNANADTIYMVAKTGGTGNQKYDEYMLINGAFEKIGDSAVDLTDYATKKEVDTAKNDAIAAAARDATTKANEAKKDAVAAAATDATTKADKARDDAITAAGTAADVKILDAIGALDVDDAAIAGQYVSSVSETDGKITVTRADLPAAATLVTGKANGTVAFNGKDVAVKGLGSAAYTNSDAYDAAGTAKTKADAALADAKTYTDTALTWGTL